MAINQNQIRDHSVVDVAAAALVGRPNEVAYVASLNNHFYYSIDALAVADAVTTFPALGTNAFWKVVGNISLKDNYAGTVPPVATDDAAAGYSVGSKWVDTTSSDVYICTDSTAASAVWVLISGADNPLASSHDNIAVAATVAASAAHTTTAALGANAAAFNASKVQVLLNGIELVKGTDVTYISAVTFSLSVATYLGDTITVR